MKTAKLKTELDKWLRETKAKNLSHDDLTELCIWMNSDLYARIKAFFNIKEGLSLADFLFNQWNNTEESPKVETEWRPKRGDRVLVWDDNKNKAEERTFLAEVKGLTHPILVVAEYYLEEYLKNEPFEYSRFKNMKPLPIEQPTETDFKSKVIEFIEGKINDLKGYEKRQIEINEYYNNHSQVASKIRTYNDLLNQIKQLS